MVEFKDFVRTYKRMCNTFDCGDKCPLIKWDKNPAARSCWMIALDDPEEFERRVMEWGAENPELKPCPFCGGEAKLEDLGWPHHVYCTECGARVTSTRTGDEGDAEVIRKWNRRNNEEV